MNHAPVAPRHEQQPAWPYLAAALGLTLVGYLLAYGGLLWTPGHVYQNWDQSFPPFPSEIRAYGSFSASTWSGIFELGSPGPMNGLTFYFDLLVRHGLAGLGGGILARWLNLAYMLVGTAGFWILARAMGLSGLSSLMVCVISQFNPRTYSLALSGHTESGFAYALTPWVIALADKAMKAVDGKSLLAAGIGAGMLLALACTSPFGVTLAGTLVTVYSLVVAIRQPARALSVFSLAIAVVLWLHMFWILPTVAGTAGSKAFKHNQSVEDIQADYTHKYREYSIPPRQAMIGHTDNLGMGTEYAWPVEPPADRWWKPSAYALLGLALLGLLGRMPDRTWKWFAAGSLLLGFWLLTGDKTMAGTILYETILARVKVLFFFMARPTRWLLVYYTGLALLAGLGLEAVRRRGIWNTHRWPDKLAAGLVVLILGVYTWPWWSGQLTRPKNMTTQTMALMPQPLLPQEKQLVDALNKDPGLYRVTVFPTITGPTGDVPKPPSSTLTRNFGMMGKDSLVGPAFIGQPFGRYLLSLAHRQAPATDSYGRLLGLGAVKEVIWDVDQPYLSYMDFGWMPQTKRGSETLSDPRGVLAPFLAAQTDLKADKDWSFGPFRILDNLDYLPRVRTATTASLAAGGFPLLADLAELPDNVFANRALFLATDVDQDELAGLGRLRGAIYARQQCGPELLLPFLPAKAWITAKSAPQGWKPLRERWYQISWFEGSPLDGKALISQAPTGLTIPLPGQGPHRLFARVANLPGQHGLNVALSGQVLAVTQSADPFDRGWRWLDLGLQDLRPDSALTVTAAGYGAVVSGVLAVPAEQYRQAQAKLDELFPPGQGGVTMAEAAACTVTNQGLYSPVRNIPLLAGGAGITMHDQGLRLEDIDGCGVGRLAAEGAQTSQVLFRLDFPRPVSGFSLVSYPRLFGDPQGLAFVEAEWSANGWDYQPLYKLTGATDGKWEDVYGRREEQAVAARTNRLWLRFTLRQAQLVSLGNPPNQPMAVTVSDAEPFPGAPASGQAVLLPGEFAPTAVHPGPQRILARLLTPEGPKWRDLGLFQPDKDGVCHVSLNQSGQALPAFADQGRDQGLACDMLEVLSLAQAPLAQAAPDLEVTRQNPASYLCQGPMPGGGLLLFSESFHPAWQARLADRTLTPLKAYGFMNAYLLPEKGPDQARLVFKPEDYRDLGVKISLAGWIGLFAALVGLLAAKRRG